MSERAVITGIGAVSGFGDGAERLWRALVEGERAMRPSDAFARVGLGEGVLASVPGADVLAPGDRATPFALRAAAEAIADAGGVVAGVRLAVSIGSTLGGIGLFLDGNRRSEKLSSDGSWGWAGPAIGIARAHGARGAVAAASVACASGNAALGCALALIREGRADQVIAGGVDALNDFVIAGFASLKALDPSPCRPFDVARRGLNLGEGAALLVVESESFARRRGARVRAFLDGYASAADANHMTGPDRDGRGALRAMRAALSDAASDERAVDFVSAHGTATLFNDAMESRALTALLGARVASVPVHSIKGALGHTLGAAGALEALVCVRVLETGLAPATLGLTDQDPELHLDIVSTRSRPVAAATILSTSSGFGGTNATIILRRA